MSEARDGSQPLDQKRECASNSRIQGLFRKLATEDGHVEQYLIGGLARAKLPNQTACGQIARWGESSIAPEESRRLGLGLVCMLEMHPPKPPQCHHRSSDSVRLISINLVNSLRANAPVVGDTLASSLGYLGSLQWLVH